MTLDTHGFFSPDMNKFRIAVKSQEPTKAWFDYARDLNTFALGLIHDQTTPPFSETQRFTLAALFIRATNPFRRP